MILERMRNGLAGRLASLIARFESIAIRANARREQLLLATELGLGINSSMPVVTEIAIKADQQAHVCSDAMTQLLDKRAFPLVFRKAVSKAERFADECDIILGQMDSGAAAGKAAAQARLGIPSRTLSSPTQPPMTAQRFEKLADLALQLAEADAAMSLKTKLHDYENRKKDNSAPNP